MRSMILSIYCVLFMCCGNMSEKHNTELLPSDSLGISEDSIISNVDTIPLYAKKVIEAYPYFEIKYFDNSLVFSDGTKIICDDGQEKKFVDRLDNCDIEDMFSMSYDIDSTRPTYLNDCGRGRCEQLFKKMYGNNEAEARRNLVSVDWFGQKLFFTRVNGAADRLKEVALELAKEPQFRKYLTNASSFYWRKVRGANRQSAHSYGIAIDINTTYSNYWLWSNPKRSETDKIKYENRIPVEVVKVFEKYGFIWGGRWYHYDTMHFEYRPELIVAKQSKK